MLYSFALTTLVAVASYAQDLQQTLIEDSRHTLRLNFSSPSPMIFHASFGLLQQWPNTFFPNGHTIAPCTIPKNTNLYHARWDTKQPPSPEWFAFDAEMSYWIAGLSQQSQLLTYRTTRDVECLYFDGQSASLMDQGNMDSQMLLIHNNSANVPNPYPPSGPPPERNEIPRQYSDGKHKYPSKPGNGSRWNPIQDEYDRADGLCRFIKDTRLGGLGWGYEGIVRMNTAFEMIWCNFSSPSVKLVSNLNVSAPMFQGKPPKQPSIRHPFVLNPFFDSASYRWFDAGALRYGFQGGGPGRGETRVKIDGCGLFSLYDPSLTDQSRVRVELERGTFNLSQKGYWLASHDRDERNAGLRKLMRRGRYQRSLNVSEADGVYMRNSVIDSMRDNLDSRLRRCSGIDWLNIIQDIVMGNSADIYDLAIKLSTDPHNFDDKELISWLAYTRDTLHNFWMPYYEYPASYEDLDRAFNADTPETLSALQRCRSIYEPFDFSEFSKLENVTYTAVSDVVSAICDTLLPVFMTVEHAWMATFNNISRIPSLSGEAREQLHLTLAQHVPEIEELMAWLGWADQWTSCSPGCSPGHRCWIPMWPVMALGPTRPWTDNSPGYPRSYPDFEEELWEPRCVDAEHFPPY